VAQLSTDARLGRYRIVSKIGAGGMGEVYLAEDTKLDRRVALKILPAELAADQDRIRRFVQEAKAGSALNHPNIITIHEIDETPSGHYLTTEFIDGETLRAYFLRSPLALAESVDIAAQIASHPRECIVREQRLRRSGSRRDFFASLQTWEGAQ
jgi:eukaryotic-like serine/threonine-protein kinase